MNGVYTCTASNVIRGSARSDTNETTINACKLFVFNQVIVILLHVENADNMKPI